MRKQYLFVFNFTVYTTAFEFNITTYLNPVTRGVNYEARRKGYTRLYSISTVFFFYYVYSIFGLYPVTHLYLHIVQSIQGYSFIIVLQIILFTLLVYCCLYIYIKFILPIINATLFLFYFLKKENVHAVLYVSILWFLFNYILINKILYLNTITSQNNYYNFYIQNIFYS